MKSFHCQILNDPQALKNEQQNYKPTPVIRKVDNGMIQRNYLSIKQDVEKLVATEMIRLMEDPECAHFRIKK